ncbi:MAG: hypothetical protein HY270_12790 [Deltaproteobacteria bacterium]|nr:hypothetical protein [Deltaproteobacteria bacterium]
MSLERLRALLDAYGANPDRWPPQERAAALALLEQSPEAQRWRDASARIDALLDHAPGFEVSATLIDRSLAAAPTPAPSANRTPPPYRHTTRRVWAWRIIAAAAPLAAAAVLVLWVLNKPSQTPERANVTLAEIETFDVPTDALLDLPSVQALDRVPTFGCAGGGLGCVDTGEADNRSQSALDVETFA